MSYFLVGVEIAIEIGIDGFDFDPDPDFDSDEKVSIALCFIKNFWDTTLVFKATVRWSAWLLYRTRVKCRGANITPIQSIIQYRLLSAPGFP